uniref:RNA-binding protein 5 n=1 Tax=Meloidogyne floridensis TaxID=298350 RepID=A0A915P970_9BILA
MSRRNRDSRSTSSSLSRSRSTSRSTYESSPRDRDYRTDRSRSRSRSRSRDRGRYSRRRSPRRRRERTRSPFSRRRSPADTAKPSSKVILTSLPSYVDKDVLNILLARQGYHPIDIRVVRRNTDGGSVRVFGFIEFSDVYTAEDWISFNKGYLKLDDGFQVRLEYSREEIAREKHTYNPLASDWTCSKCTINNFNRRTNCFKCGTSRQESDAMEAKGYAMVGVSPSDSNLFNFPVYPNTLLRTKTLKIALLIRELPVTVTEEIIRSSLGKYTDLTIQRVQISSSKLYAFVQMRSSDEAGTVLHIFNKTVPYIDNCADPTNSAAQLAQNAIRIANMGRSTPNATPAVSTYEVPPRQCVSTPFGYLPVYETPDPKSFQFEPSSGYYYDTATGFYFDSKTQYYFNTNTNHWMFWSHRYSCYIDCHGGDDELKSKLQEEERLTRQSTESCSIANLPTCSSNELETNLEQSHVESLAVVSSKDEVAEESNKPVVKRKRKHKDEDENKPKTPQEIQKEMEKWARRQDKIKMSFKQPQIPVSTVEKSSVSNVMSKPINKNVVESQLEPIKKPWDDDDDDGSEVVPAGAALPGKYLGVTHRLFRVRKARAQMSAGLAVSSDTPIEQSNDQQQPLSGNDHGDSIGAESDDHSNAFDESKYIDQTKKFCLLCRRQFPDVQSLDKHVNMSNLHKNNLMAKVKELQEEKGCTPEQRYRDRARERRSHFGYDPGLKDEPEESSAEVTHAVAAYKAAKPLDSTNVGNRMLKSMGWSEGCGLGRNLQGIVQPIQAEQHVQGVGLGSSGSKIDVNASWKDRNRKSAIQRFNDLHDT